MTLVRLVQVDLRVCFVLVAVLSSLADFIPESKHFFHLDVVFGSLARLVHDIGWFFAQTVCELARGNVRSMECNVSCGLRFWI